MRNESEIIRAEIPDVARIVSDECWLEGERRGEPVSPHDEEIQCRVAEIIIAEAGAVLRARHTGSETA
jgi:hypothetical protein